jgi:hypothetical protein
MTAGASDLALSWCATDVLGSECGGVRAMNELEPIALSTPYHCPFECRKFSTSFAPEMIIHQVFHLDPVDTVERDHLFRRLAAFQDRLEPRPGRCDDCLLRDVTRFPTFFGGDKSLLFWVCEQCRSRVAIGESNRGDEDDLKNALTRLSRNRRIATGFCEDISSHHGVNTPRERTGTGRSCRKCQNRKELGNGITGNANRRLSKRYPAGIMMIDVKKWNARGREEMDEYWPKKCKLALYRTRCPTCHRLWSEAGPPVFSHIRADRHGGPRAIWNGFPECARCNGHRSGRDMNIGKLSEEAFWPYDRDDYRSLIAPVEHAMSPSIALRRIAEEQPKLLRGALREARDTRP